MYILLYGQLPNCCSPLFIHKIADGRKGCSYRNHFQKLFQRQSDTQSKHIVLDFGRNTAVHFLCKTLCNGESQS